MSKTGGQTDKKILKQEKQLPLSARMRALVSVLEAEVSEHGMISCVADIGCDHAFVSMACVQRHLAKRVIAMDVRKGPLAIAANNIQLYGFEKSVETRLSDGFEKLLPGEAAWAVIAGMGGKLMCRILEAGKMHMEAGIGLVLQPQSEADVVRLWLQTKGYAITDERFLKEEGKFYTIIKAIKRPETDENTEMNPAELLYGPLLLQRRDPVLMEYIGQEYQKKRELYDRLKKQKSDSSRERQEQLEQELHLLHMIKTRQ